MGLLRWVEQGSIKVLIKPWREIPWIHVCPSILAERFLVDAGQCMLKLVNIHDARPEAWNFDTLEILKIAFVDGRLDLGEVPCHVLPRLAWNSRKET